MMLGAEYIQADRTHVLVRLSQLRTPATGFGLVWQGLVVLAGEGFYTAQETTYFKDIEECCKAMEMGTQLLHPDFADDIKTGIADARRDALNQMAIERTT